jgi:hypothetical protein
MGNKYGPAELLDKINRLKQEREALKQFWAVILPGTEMPCDRQFTIWLDLYSPLKNVADSLEVCAAWLNQNENDGQEKSLDDIIRYASGIMVKKQQDQNIVEA